MKKIIKPKQQSKLHFDMIVTKTDNKLRDAQVVLSWKREYIIFNFLKVNMKSMLYTREIKSFVYKEIWMNNIETISSKPSEPECTVISFHFWKEKKIC